MSREPISNNILYIDTSSNKEIKVGLKISGEEDVVVQEVGESKAQIVLPLIDKLLRKHKLSIKDLSGIEVNPGPGSFTGLRVGVAIANALGFALHISINGKKTGEYVEPEYE